MKNLKIGFLLDTSLDPPDGVQQYILSLGQWLRSEGHDVHYLVGETTRVDIPNTYSLSKNISVTFNGNKMTIPLWANKKAVKKVFRENDFDILHVQSPHHPLMAQYVIKRAPARTAIVSTFHILPYNKLAYLSSKVLGYALKPSLKRVDAAISVSRTAATFQKETFGIDSQIFPNVFDYKRFQGAKPFDRKKDRNLTILFLGRLVERKGCQHLLRAINQLDRANLPKFKVVVCGNGGMLGDLQNYAIDNGLDDIVEFAGFVSEDDKPRYYASADISVFPSTSGESFGIVLLEAMASGKSAVLAGRNPGYETVMESRPETLFDPKHESELVDKLTELLNNTKKRSEISEWGRRHTIQYDVSVVGPKIIHTYELAIASRQKKQHNKD